VRVSLNSIIYWYVFGLLFSSYTNNQAANAYDAIEVLLLGAASRSAGYGWGNPVSLAFAVFFFLLERNERYGTKWNNHGTNGSVMCYIDHYV
jgi:hypothetical protein